MVKKNNLLDLGNIMLLNSLALKKQWQEDAKKALEDLKNDINRATSDVHYSKITFGKNYKIALGRCYLKEGSSAQDCITFGASASLSFKIGTLKKIYKIVIGPGGHVFFHNKREDITYRNIVLAKKKIPLLLI